MLIRRNSKKKWRGQVVLELAAFGAVFLFILGQIVRQSLSSKHQFFEKLLGMRMAIRLSYLESQGIGKAGGGEDGNKSRDQSSIVLVEDRLDSTSKKYGTDERIPHFVMGSATATVNQLMPVEEGEDQNVSVMDVYINGKHFILSVARLVNKQPRTIYEKIVQGNKNWNAEDAKRFDLDRNGTVDVPEEIRGRFEWQWMKVNPSDVDPEMGEHTSIDIDQDLKEERIIDKWFVMDFQDGDIDGGYDDLHSKIYNECDTGARSPSSFWCKKIRWRSGLSASAKAYSQFKDGTLLRIEEGKLYDGDTYVRNTTFKDQPYLISREIRLANNTRRHCKKNGKPRKKVSGYKNKIKVCCDTPDCCDSEENLEKTCMYTGQGKNANFSRDKFPVIYVRTKIEDIRGRKWITKVSQELGDDLFVE